jgi:hypothetical protein
MEHKANDPLSCSVYADKAGHVWVFCFSEEQEGLLEVVFPNKTEKDTSVTENAPKRVRMNAPSPAGRYRLRAVWTENPVIDTGPVDFDNRFETQETLERFLHELEGERQIPWQSTDQQFAVGDSDTKR